jgi:tRNA threonylcarbamoyladenosine biosynthesis protein TsaB
VLTLALDTTSSSLSVAILDNKQILAQNIIFESGKQSELLIPEIEKILCQEKIWYQNLNLIAATNGPGSFTGSRIGLTAARILKLATNLPLILVNSCETIAYKYRKKDGKKFVAIDAAMDEFFCAQYLVENEKIIQLSEPVLASFEELSQVCPQEHFFLCGSGKKKAAEILEKENIKFEISDDEDSIEASLVGLLALEKFQNGAEMSENLNPLYLRAPKITERKK